jgi:predicted metal-dependent hydrolase
MLIHVFGVFLVILIVVFIIFFYPCEKSIDASDGIVYKVATELSLEEQEKSAKTLQEVNRRFMILLEHLRESYGIDDDHRNSSPPDFRAICESRRLNVDCVAYKRRMEDIYTQVRRLLTLYQTDKLEENLPSMSSKETSFTIGKGVKVKLCLRDKSPERRLYNINMIMFVAVHELAHIACDERVIGDPHTEKFWSIFRFLLLECERIKLFKIPNYTKHPVDYSGIEIRYSPIHNRDGDIRWFESDEDLSSPIWRQKGNQANFVGGYCHHT